MDTVKHLLAALSLAFVSGVGAQEPAADATAPDEPQAAPRSDSASGTNAHTARLNRINAFQSLDANADGAVSPDEANVSPALSSTFQALDADQNGGLTDAELARFEATDAAKNSGPQGQGDAAQAAPAQNAAPDGGASPENSAPEEPAQ